MHVCAGVCAFVHICIHLKGGVDGTAGTANAVPLSESLYTATPYQVLR